MKHILLLFTILLLVHLNPAKAQLSINADAGLPAQTIDGFGGSIAYYENWLVAHSKRAMIYDHLFKDLGISILRTRNMYMNEGGINQGISDMRLIFLEAKKRNPVDLMISSWTPPAAYKSNGKEANEGTQATLKTDTEGKFIYGEFASWWFHSLLEYRKKGMDVKYISIQNEPNFAPDYEGCIFMPQEKLIYDAKLGKNVKVASYAIAFSRVYDTIHSHSAELNILPGMIGPEVFGIENAWSGKPGEYTIHMDMSKCYGMAHHLYTGGTETNPASFVNNMSLLASAFPDIPKMQTEYGRGDWLATASLMHYSLVTENVSCYMCWELFWPGSDFLDLENPWNSSSWKYPNGYKVGKKFHAFRQYSAFIKPGWQRVQTIGDVMDVLSSAYINPEKNRLVMVLINSGLQDKTVNPGTDGFTANSVLVHRTSETEDFTEVSFVVGGEIALPAKSVTTLVFSTVPDKRPEIGDWGTKPELVCRPNPFREQVRIELNQGIPEMRIRIFNSLGEPVISETIRSEGIFDWRPRTPGVYLVQVSDGNRLYTQKVVCLK